MGYKKLKYKNSSFLEIIHPKKKVPGEKKRINYYPFGLQHKGYNNVVSANSNSLASKFKYQGQELEETLGLDLYEFDLRQYDPALGRFMTTDPYEQFMSPYVGMGNDWVNGIDPDGGENEDWFYNSKTGEVYYNSEMRIGDESLLGANWEHLGENGMFGVSDISLLNDFNVVGNFTAIESSFNPIEGKSFMKEQGYNFNPVQMVKYNHELKYAVPNVPTTIKWGFETTEKSKYMTKDYIRTDAYFSIDNQELKAETHLVKEVIGRYEIIYDNSRLGRVLHFLTLDTGMKPAVHNSWNDMSIDKNNDLLNKFIIEYGKQ